MPKRTVTQNRNASLTVDDTRLQAMLTRLAKIPDARVGVLQSEQHVYPTGLSVVVNAAIHELGLGVPRRSWLRDWVNPRRNEIRKRLSNAIQNIALREADPGREMGSIAAWAVGEIQQRIAGGIAPPNSFQTVAAKGSSKPLIDTGRLRTSISWALDKFRVG